MNLISLVTSFILLLAISSHSLLFKRTLSEKTQISFTGNLHAARKAQNAYELNHFQRADGKRKKIKTNLYQKIKKTSPIKKKNPPPPKYPEVARLNIFSLFKEGKDAHPKTYELFANLLRVVYKEPLFFQKDLEYQLIDQMILAAKTQLKEIENVPIQTIYLEKLSLKDQNLQTLYYRILKGTKMHDFEKREGFVSLLDLICSISNAQDTIYLPFASLEMLYTLFPKKSTVDKILKEEFTQDGFIPLTKEKFEKILSSEFDRSNSIAKDFINFDHSKQTQLSKTVKGQDPLTEITIKREMFF